MSPVRGGIHGTGQISASVSGGEDKVMACRNKAVSDGFSDNVRDVTGAVSGCFGKHAATEDASVMGGSG